MDKHALRVLEYDKIKELIATKAVSTEGRESILSMSPSNDRKRVERWQEETAEALSFIYKKGSSPLGSFDSVEAPAKRARVGSVLGCGELLRVARSLNCASEVQKRLYEFDEIITDAEGKEVHSTPELFMRAEALVPHMAVAAEITRCIESEDTVNDYASPELGRLRRQTRSIQDQIQSKLTQIIHSQSYAKLLQDQIVTVRSDRYVVPVKQEYRSSFAGIVHDQSASGATLFIEPMAIVELNNKLREAELAEKKEIERILALLSAEVEGISSDLLENQRVLVGLDMIFSKAKYARELSAIRPNISEKRLVLIKQGRHPLIPREKVVPVDMNVGEGYTSLVITGPNTGGKTVTLKTAGLFVLMAQSGLHLPANEGTTLGIFSDVLADIGDEQSIEQNLSTFSSHMKNIVDILANMSRSSLVLFDELGAGTDPTEGAALAMAILDQLCEKNIVTMATTHYSELKAFAMTRSGMRNAAMEFDVETLRPTYRLLIGVPGKSNAFLISRKLGLPEDTIVRANGFIETEDARMEDVIADLELERKDAAAALEEAEKELAAARMERKSAEEERKRAIERANADQEKSRAEAHQVLSEAKEQAAEIIRQLNELRKNGGIAVSGKDFENLRNDLNNSLKEMDRKLAPAKSEVKHANKAPESLKVGDSVHVISLDKDGTVVEYHDGKNEAAVQCGILRMDVKLSDLIKLEGTASEIKLNTEHKKLTLRNNALSSSVDLRGLDAQSAIMKTDRYLDEAFLAGLHEVTVIHGAGTGVLRAEVGKFLKRHAHVASTRPGGMGEGGSGVTIVTIK